MKTIPIRSLQPQEPKGHRLEGFKIRSLSDVLGGKDLNHDLHRHDFYFILVVKKGAGFHAIDFHEHAVRPGAIFIIRPGQVHRLQLKAGSEGFLLELGKDFHVSSTITASELLREAGSRNFCQVDKRGIDQLCSALQTMLEEYQSKQERFEIMIKANLEIFLINYLRYRQNNPDTDVKVKPYQQEKLQQFLHLLEEHIKTEKLASAYAEMVSLSPFQLNSITKRLLGKTVTKLIEDQILLEAKRYLLTTSNQVYQIALELGFEDVSYFIRLFKKLTGQTPESFRKNFR